MVSTTVIGAEGGYSNYIPGTYGDFGMALMPTESWTVRSDIFNYKADASRSIRNGLVEANVELDFNINLNTVIFKPDIQLLGGQYAFGTLIPLVDVKLDASVQLSNQFREIEGDATGLGDVVLIPLILFWQSGNYHFSLAEYIFTPTGDYDPNKPMNHGLNYWSFDSNFAATYLNPETGQDYSINVGHIYNTENSDTDYQTGQEIHIDVALNQFFSETFAIGVHGFYLNQITDDDGAGALFEGFRAKTHGYGPAVLWTPKIGEQDFAFIAKWLKETSSENRLKGDYFMLSVAFDW